MDSQAADQAHPYDALTPDTLLDAVEGAGFAVDGRLLALNSYENRVYQLGLAEGGFIVAKFYRPGRWSEAQIREEHAFAAELVEAEIPVVAPLLDANGESLHQHAGFHFALFERRGGRPPELEDGETLYRLGRFLARIHNIGAARPFTSRISLDIERFGVQAYRFLLEQGFVPPEHQGQYRDLAETMIEAVREGFARAGKVTSLRIHGDFHPGNILWTDEGAHIVDLDDCLMGPAVQDLWMLTGGEGKGLAAQWLEIIEGYEEFRDFNRRELHLVEPLRALRLLHYSAWLARRWDDPAFPRAFPWFNSPTYWDEQIHTLRGQLLRLEQGPPSLGG